MKKFIAAAAAAVMLMTAGAAQAATQVKVGVLTCTVDPGIGFIIGSSKDMTCRFKRDGYKTERYQGNIKKLMAGTESKIGQKAGAAAAKPAASHSMKKKGSHSK